MSVKYYQVGGSVRDAMLKVPSKDIDYAVEAGSFEEMIEDLNNKGAEIFLAKPEYLTIRAKYKGAVADFVLCRKDGSYYDGRHPDSVTPGTILDDLARRDFTMNAMAIDEDGKLIDPYMGQAACSYRIISCVGKPEDRFTEDGLRLLRAFRFMITKRMVLVTNISVLLRDQTFFEPRLAGVSIERIREELFKCFHHDTQVTLNYLNIYPDLRRYLFGLKEGVLWLKPTLEYR